MEQPDSATLAYLSRLPLALSALPVLSSASSLSYFAHAASSSSDSLATKCGCCRAEVVVGLNASCWSERGSLWASCEGCGAVSRKSRTAGEGVAAGLQGGKGQLERVKKRRRVETRLRKEATHATQVAGSTKPAAHASETPSARSAQIGHRRVGLASTTGGTAAPAHSARPTSVLVPSSAHPPSRSADPAPSKSRPRPVEALQSNSKHAVQAATAPTGADHPHAAAPSASSTLARSAPAPRASATNASGARGTVDTAAAAGAGEGSKKRKRPKQPSGLAELLEAKKRREKEESQAKGGGGLADFLQGL
ncbi:uncharacterized protein JCM10292_001670 [Rhodotorula paludigena]|uniref:uncharacterized protein n=1 Tax=Rhodotorula paludigena TaxID=86838 RepID=UPI0031704C29